MKPYAKVIHAPDIPPRIRHQTIVEAFDSLNAGETLLLKNDHDPLPLFYQFQATRTGEFSWNYVLEGPEEYEVEIRKERSTQEG